MNTSLAIIQPDELETIQRTGKLLAMSGYFDAKGDAPQAIAMIATKIMAGREIGIGPFASVNGIHIISGKPSIGANLLASAVKGSGRYDYRIREMSAQACRIEFFQKSGDKWESLGISEFTAEEARKAGTKNMDKFPKNMLFARAMSNGVRFYTPDVFNGNAVYVPEELGADVNENGDVITVEATRVVNQGTGEITESSSANIHPTVGEWLNQAQPVEAAKTWAMEVGACGNEFEAKNSLKKIVDTNGGRLNKDNLVACLSAFYDRQQEKLAEAAEAASVVEAEPAAF
jgi:hypothetical protein